MTAVDFRKHVIFRPDGEPSQAFWRVQDQGREVRKQQNNNSILIG